MSQTYEFYAARAAEAANEAAQAQLENVRERALRAESKWLALAKQARKVADDREKARQEREARNAAAAQEKLVSG